MDAARGHASELAVEGVDFRRVRTALGEGMSAVGPERQMMRWNRMSALGVLRKARPHIVEQLRRKCRVARRNFTSGRSQNRA